MVKFLKPDPSPKIFISTYLFTGPNFLGDYSAVSIARKIKQQIKPVIRYLVMNRFHKFCVFQKALKSQGIK